jgi:hypothetical protein
VTMLDDSSKPTGLAADPREGSTIHTSATTGPARSLEQATTAALTSLIRTSDERGLEIDVMTLNTRIKTMRAPGSDPSLRVGDARATIFMVLATATGYPA